MFYASLPSLVTGLFVVGGITAGTATMALPALNAAPEESISASTPTATPTSTPTPTSPPASGNTSQLPWDNNEVGNGVMLHDLPQGLTATVNSRGVVFSYIGPCMGGPPTMTIRGDNGRVYSTGGSPECHGNPTFAANSFPWDENVRNSYCYSPLGGASAYRAEIFGLASQWVPIPEEFKVCINGQAPEGPSAPGIPGVTPEAPAPPASEVPAPPAQEPAPAPSESSPGTSSQAPTP